MKKNFTLYLGMAFLCFQLSIASAFAKIIQVASPGNDNDIQPAIQAAVDQAVDGDVIQLPEGIFVVNKSVVVTKFVSIMGKGLSKTILYRSESVADNTLSYDAAWNGMFRFDINQNVSSNILVADICFRSKIPSVVNGDGKSRAADIGVKFVRCLDFVVTRCRFEYFGNGAVSVYHDDNIVGGLIYKNEFYHNTKGYDALGLGYGVVIYGSNYEWVADPKFGTSNFIFIEDNLFDYHRHSIAAGGAALYVFRYNTVLNNVAGNTAHAIDMHEARLGGPGTENNYSTRATEIYNNRIVNTTYKDGISAVPAGTPIQPGGNIDWLTESCIRPRGGEALVHHNYIQGYRFGVGIITGLNNIGTPGVYPWPYQTGYNSGVQYGSSHTGVEENRGAGDVFMWDDTFHFHAPGQWYNTYFYNYSPTYIAAERDYHFYAKANYTPYTYPHPLRALGELPTHPVNEHKILSFDIIPNPNHGIFTFRFATTRQDNYTVVIYNALGNKVAEKKLTGFKGTYTTTFDITSFGKGIYLASLVGTNSIGAKPVLVY